MARAKSKRLFGLKLTQSKLLLLSVVAIIVLGAGAIAWARYAENDSPESSEQSSDSDGSSANSDVDLSPPTDEDRAETEAHKQDLGNQQNSASSSSGKKQVTPVIVNKDKNGASAYVQGVFEDGGTCTATFVHGQDKVTASSKGFKNVSYTSCEPMTLPGPLNIEGDWTVTVTYSSSTAEGKSAPETFNVD